VSQAVVEGLLEPRAYHQLECYESAVLWARTEGFIPAPETSHAICAAIEEAKKAKEEGKEKVIVFNWSGHGLMDLTGYEKYLTGQLHDFPLPEEYLSESLQSIKDLPKPEIHRTGKW
jgi:tryptophan synthase beta chain